jgi:hypothetical protein
MICCPSEWNVLQILRRAVPIVLFFGCAAAPVPAQLNARPASVVLVATLESLSMGVAPTSAQPVSAGMPHLAVTTSWALPANLTTLHLVQLSPDMDLTSGGFTIFSQSSGDSNRASSRAEVLEVPADPKAAFQPNPKLSQKSTLLLIEAL